MLILPRRLTQQPNAPQRALRGHWLAHKFQHVFVPGIAGGTDLLGDAVTVPFGAGSAMPGLGSIAAGRVMTQDGVDDIAAHTSPGIAGSASYPIIQAACGYFNSSANNWYLGGTSRSGSGGGENCGTRLEGTTGIGYLFRVNFGPTINPIVTTGAGTNSGLLICLIAQSLSATNHRLYANGLMTTDSTDAGPLAGTYDKLALGGAAGGLNGGLLWSGFGFREAFTDNEALLLSANPALFWSLFAQRRLWIGAAAVANPLTGTLGQFDPELRIAAWF